MLMWIVVLVIAAVVVVVAAATVKPKTFSIVRSAQINAPADRIHGLINDFHKWTAWSPWERMDPALMRTYEGVTEGKGAIYSWRGNKKVGQGRMEITGTTPSQIDIDLHFLKPFEARNKTIFNVTEAPIGTAVRWEMQGSAPLMFRIMGLFMNMDDMIGKDFERGLANMKQVAEEA